MSFAGNYLITSKGWNLLQFAGEMDALTGQNMTFHTLPITGQESVGDIGAVNTVDPAQIQAIVKKGFTAPPPDKTSGRRGKASAKPKTDRQAGHPGAARVHGHGGRLQRRHHARAGRPGVAGAGRQGLQGRAGAERERAASRRPPLPTARARRPTRRSSPSTSASPRPPVAGWRPGTCRSSWARPPPRCRPRSAGRAARLAPPRLGHLGLAHPDVKRPDVHHPERRLGDGQGEGQVRHPLRVLAGEYGDPHIGRRRLAALRWCG